MAYKYFIIIDMNDVTDGAQASKVHYTNTPSHGNEDKEMCGIQIKISSKILSSERFMVIV